MAYTTYNEGDSRKLQASFYNTSDALFNPTTVTFKFRKPGGTTTTYVYGTDVQLVRSSTGIYYVILTFDVPGKWYYEWQCTGGTEVEPREILVLASRF